MTALILAGSILLVGGVACYMLHKLRGAVDYLAYEVEHLVQVTRQQ